MKLQGFHPWVCAMRVLSFVIVLALALLAGLAALNASELSRATELNLGWRTVQAPLGLWLLALACGGLLQRQLDEVGSSLAACIGEVEDRLERRHLLRPPGEKRPPCERH